MLKRRTHLWWASVLAILLMVGANAVFAQEVSKAPATPSNMQLQCETRLDANGDGFLYTRAASAPDALAARGAQLGNAANAQQGPPRITAIGYRTPDGRMIVQPVGQQPNALHSFLQQAARNACASPNGLRLNGQQDAAALIAALGMLNQQAAAPAPFRILVTSTPNGIQLSLPMTMLLGREAAMQLTGTGSEIGYLNVAIPFTAFDQATTGGGGRTVQIVVGSPQNSLAPMPLAPAATPNVLRQANLRTGPGEN